MKKINFIIGLLLINSVVVLAQNIDQERMNRDLEVAENVLYTLMKQQIERIGTLYLDNVKSNYLQDYGVIFTVPQNQHVWGRGAVSTVTVGEGNAVVVDTDRQGYSYTIKARDLAEAEEKIKLINIDSIEQAKNEKYINTLKTFLADYGNLIGQLKDSDKIMITNRNNRYEFFNSNRESTELTVEASVADILAYKQGKISREKMIERVKITDRTVSTEKATDLELLSSIFERLYRSDLSKTYYTSGKISYDRLSDYGVIYRMKVYSSTNSNNFHQIVTRQVDGLSQEERDKIVKEMYPEFVANLKENILDYGKTLSSLKPNENLMFQVELTKCIGCGIPKAIELSLKNEILQQYSMGKISRNDALKKISLKEIDSQ